MILLFVAVIWVLLLIPTCIFAIALCRVASIADKQERIAFQQWFDSNKSNINKKGLTPHEHRP